ncbi:hypothetical protein UFOVP325_59 [uncultured Caudovirales phage]|uniref:Uncharacterized protein n=1 Tax=uncultured Caudovirales phage TaxID=2100421 RepID=A0A6J5LT58_9CAUD|nr:hypothetical protein UFOVP325_59 [uncultured Caudovirales phage]CAB4147938.1 hypothetical protein UFOVP430_54 [uncultured Caudovirales phage]
MSKLSALASIYTAGMKAEHLRMRDVMENHLRTEHDWTTAQLEALFHEVSKSVLLDTPVPNACIVCHTEYDDEPTKFIYEQQIHESCTDGMTDLFQMFNKEEHNG